MKIRSFLIFALVLLFVHDNNGKKNDHNVSKGESNKGPKLSQVVGDARTKQEVGKQAGRKIWGGFRKNFETGKRQQTKTQSGSKKEQIKSDVSKKSNMSIADVSAKIASTKVQPASSASVPTSNTTNVQAEPSTLGQRVSHGMPYLMTAAGSPYNMYKKHHFFGSQPMPTQEHSSQRASSESKPEEGILNSELHDDRLQSIISSQYVQPSMEQAPALTVLQPRSSSADIGDGTLTSSSMSVNVSVAVNRLLTGGTRLNDSDSSSIDILNYLCNNQSAPHQSPIATLTQPQPVALDQSSSTESTQLLIVTPQSSRRIEANASDNVPPTIGNDTTQQPLQPCDFLNLSIYKVFNDEIKKLSESLFDLDKNNGYKYVTVNLQNVTKEDNIVDDALVPLLSVNQKMYEIRTIKSLLTLYDDYELDVKKNETIISEGSKEESELLDTFLETDVFKATMKFLADKEFLPNDIYKFKDSLERVWFTKFKRVEGEPSSSGFEALFLAEKLGDYMIGPQNWIYYAKQEELKKLDYRGYIKNVKLGEKAEVIKIRTAFNIPDTKQSVTTLLVGLSPELEMALYTVCFYVRPNDVCPISLGGKEVIFVSARFNYFDKDIMISSFVAG